MDKTESQAGTERDEILSDIAIAEGQIARGEGVDHDGALERVLSRISHRERDELRMTHQEVRLVLQTALLGEIGERLRAVGYRLDNDAVGIQFHFDGPISNEDRESAACVVTEVIAALPVEVRVSEEVIRCDHPARIPIDLPLVYYRREQHTG